MASREARRQLNVAADEGEDDAISDSASASFDSQSASMSQSESQSASSPSGAPPPTGGWESSPGGAATALRWSKAELTAHLRSKPGLGNVAAYFDRAGVDGKTLALMEASDLTGPPPNACGLDPSEPAFKQIWEMVLKLKAALPADEIAAASAVGGMA